MGRNDEMAYYSVVGPKATSLWDAYRRKWLEYREALSDACNELGHQRVVLGFKGEIIGAERRPDGSLHPAFNPKKQQRNGAYGRVHRGRTTEAKEAAAALEEINAGLMGLSPDPQAVAKVAGFIHHLSYKTEGGGEGWTTVGPAIISWAQPLWLGVDKPIVLYTTDASVAIERLKARPDVLSVEPASWSVPEGYERISKARWDLMVAQHEIEKEEKANGEAPLE